MFINRYVQVIKYWFKGISLQNIIVKSFYDNSSNNVHGDNWSFKVNFFLESYGFSDVWLHPEQIYVPTFISSFKQRISDVFFNKNLSNNNVLNIFQVNLKLPFGYETYLSIITDFTTRRYLARIRISANKLRLNLGRFRERIPRIERRCELCPQSVPVDLEYEFHFVLKCQCFTDIGNRCINRYFRVHPSMFKVLKLLNSTNKRVLSHRLLVHIRTCTCVVFCVSISNPSFKVNPILFCCLCVINLHIIIVRLCRYLFIKLTTTYIASKICDKPSDRVQ